MSVMNNLLRYGTEPKAFEEGFSAVAHDNEVNFILIGCSKYSRHRCTFFKYMDHWHVIITIRYGHIPQNGNFIFVVFELIEIDCIIHFFQSFRKIKITDIGSIEGV